jgi:hypothetical protein
VCRTCRWWEPISKRIQGLCRRYPPTVQLDHQDAHPMSEGKDWCGEWQSMSVSQMNERAKASEDTASA